MSSNTGSICKQPEDGKWLLQAHIPDPSPWLRGSLVCPLLVSSPPNHAPNPQCFDKTSRDCMPLLQPLKQLQRPQPINWCQTQLPVPRQTLDVGEPGFVGRGRNWGQEGPLFQMLLFNPHRSSVRGHVPMPISQRQKLRPT